MTRSILFVVDTKIKDLPKANGNARGEGFPERRRPGNNAVEPIRKHIPNNGIQFVPIPNAAVTALFVESRECAVKILQDSVSIFPQHM